MASASLSALFEAHAAVTPQFKEVKKTRKVPQGARASEDGERANQGEKTFVAEGKIGGRRQRTQTQTQEDPRASRTVFVGNLPITFTRRKLRRLFSKYGAVESVRMRSLTVDKGKLPRHAARRTQRQLAAGSSFNAYVVFRSESEAESALALSGSEVDGRHLRLDLASRTGGRGHPHKRSVFVGNLPFDADEEALRAAFEECGAVESVRVVRDRRVGVGKGFGFVLFRERSGVLFALKRNGEIELKGRMLRVFRSKDAADGAATLGQRKQSGLPKFAGAQAQVPGEETRDRPARKRFRGKEGRKDQSKLRPRRAALKKTGCASDPGKSKKRTADAASS